MRPLKTISDSSSALSHKSYKENKHKVNDCALLNILECRDESVGFVSHLLIYDRFVYVCRMFGEISRIGERSNLE